MKKNESFNCTAYTLSTIFATATVIGGAGAMGFAAVYADQKLGINPSSLTSVALLTSSGLALSYFCDEKATDFFYNRITTVLGRQPE